MLEEEPRGAAGPEAATQGVPTSGSQTAPERASEEVLAASGAASGEHALVPQQGGHRAAAPQPARSGGVVVFGPQTHRGAGGEEERVAEQGARHAGASASDANQSSPVALAVSGRCTSSAPQAPRCHAWRVLAGWHREASGEGAYKAVPRVV